jgi:predicted dinucleotide-binding enzyme
VIKAFNNIYADHFRNLGKPEGTPGRIALPVSGDNADAKAVVMQLVNETGFDAFDNSGVNNSWRQQPGTPVTSRFSRAHRCDKCHRPEPKFPARPVPHLPVDSTHL